ncbi:hypothetical protein ACIGW8_25340 [Streptomyces sioyaensis]|uniref:hypothetical protein n=1 Tax=Streptomyces sioyaensis TaxID=67364 RepID=UPI0037D3CA69
MSWKKDPETDIDFTATATGATHTALPPALRRGRTVVAAALIAVAALSLTACGSGQSSPKPSTKVSTSPGPVNRSKEAAALGNAAADEDAETDPKARQEEKDGGQSAGANGKKAGGGSPTSGAGTDTGSTAGSGAADGSGPASHGKGGNGTWTGVLKYLAPGKLTVTPASGTEQAFFVGSGTKTLGAATICASNGNVTVDSSGYGTSPCTEEQLEKAAKRDSVEVRVTVEGGVATRIAEHYRP